MTNVIRSWLFAAVVVQVMLVSSSHAQPVWQPVPIRTAAQKAKGLVGGEGFQAIQYIAYAPSNTNIAYMVDDMGGIWKSSDAGASWQKRTKGFNPISTRYVGVHPTNENLVFVISGYVSWDDVNNNGIHRSTDGGENWKLVRQTFYNIGGDGMRRGNLIAFGSNVIYAATVNEGILKSTDNGTTWTPYALNGQKVVTVQLHPSDPSILFASSQTNNALYKITNNGTAITTIGWGLPHYANHFVIDKNNANNIYAILFRNGVYKSTNGGVNFVSLNANFTPAANFTNFGAAHIAMSPADPNYLYVSMDGYDYSEKSATLYYTHDAGAHWYDPTTMDEQIAGQWVSGSTHWQGKASRESWHISPTAPHPTNRDVALGVGGYSSHVIRTTDGGVNWRYSNSGHGSGHVGYWIMAAHSTPFVWDRLNPNRFAFSVNDYGSYMTLDGGDTFRYIGAPPYGNETRSYAGAFDPTPGSQTIIIGIGPSNGQILTVSNDNGTTWTQKPETLKTGTSYFDTMPYQFIDFNPQNPNIVYADKRKSTDKGKTWTTLSKTISAMYPANGNIVYSADQYIAKSTDAGVTWTTPYPKIDSSDIRFITIHPSNPDKIYVATGDKGLFIINGSSVSLRNSANGLLNGSARSVDVDPKNPNIVYVGIYTFGTNSNKSVFRSTDGGNTFADISSNLSSQSVNTISVNPHNSYVYVASAAGTYKLPPPGGADTTPPQAPKGLRVVQ